MTRLVTVLDEPSPRGLEDLGGRWDSEILEATRQFTALDEPAKREVREAMTRDRSWALVSWADTMASLGVRARSRETLRLGLVGLSLFDRRDFDPREAILIYPLSSAQRS